MAPASMSTATSYTQAPKLRVIASNDAAAETKQTPPELVTEAKATALDKIKRGDGRNHGVAAEMRPYLSYPLPKSHSGLDGPNCMTYPPVNGRPGRASARDTSIKDAQISNKVSHSNQRHKSSVEPAKCDQSRVTKGDRTTEEGVPLRLTICVTRKKLFSGEYEQTCRHPSITRLPNDKAVFELMRVVFDECKPEWARKLRYLIPFLPTSVCLSTIHVDRENHFDVWGTDMNTAVSEKAKERYICNEVETDNPALRKTFLLSRFKNPKRARDTRYAWYWLPKRMEDVPQMPDPATGSEFFSAAAEEHGVEIVTEVAKVPAFCWTSAWIFAIFAIVAATTGKAYLWTTGSIVIAAAGVIFGLWK